MAKRNFNVTKIMFLVSGGLVLYLLYVWVGSRQPIHKADVAGVYQSQRSYGIDILTLKANSNYNRVRKLSSGRIFKDRGKWRFSEEDNTVWLDNVVEVDYDTGVPITNGKKGIWGAVVIRAKGSLILEINSDEGTYFEKVR